MHFRIFQGQCTEWEYFLVIAKISNIFGGLLGTPNIFGG